MKRNFIIPIHDSLKSDVFSLGMIFLEIALLEFSYEIYDFENYEIIYIAMETKLENLRNKYNS